MRRQIARRSLGCRMVTVRGRAPGRFPALRSMCMLSTMESSGDPVADLILHGEASTVDEAEEVYLDRHLDEVVRLGESTLSDEEFRRHPLIVLLLARGSRGFEDSLV